MKLTLTVILLLSVSSCAPAPEIIRVDHWPPQPPPPPDSPSGTDCLDADVVHMGDLFFNGSYPFIDVDNGGNLGGMVTAIDNVATASGEGPDGTPVTATDDESVPLAGIEIDKDADLETASPGDTIVYTYTVTNIGSTVLTDIVAQQERELIERSQWQPVEVSLDESVSVLGGTVRENPNG